MFSIVHNNTSVTMLVCYQLQTEQERLGLSFAGSVELTPVTTTSITCPSVSLLISAARMSPSPCSNQHWPLSTLGAGGDQCCCGGSLAEVSGTFGRTPGPVDSAAGMALTALTENGCLSNSHLQRHCQAFHFEVDPMVKVSEQSPFKSPHLKLYWKIDLGVVQSAHLQSADRLWLRSRYENHANVAYIDQQNNIKSRWIQRINLGKF